MKGIFSLILAVLMTVSLDACSSPEEKKGNSISGAGKGRNRNYGDRQQCIDRLILISFPTVYRTF